MMDNKSTHPLYIAAGKARQEIKRGNISDVIEILRSAAESSGSGQAVRSSIDKIAAEYDKLKNHWLGGASNGDPIEVDYDEFVSRLSDFLLRLERSALSLDAPSLYFNTVRYLRTKSGDNFATLHVSLDHAVAEDTASPSRWSRVRLEEVARDLFLRLWTGHPLSAEALDEVSLIILDPRYPVTVRCQLVSAMTLGLIEYYDENRLLKLLDIYFSADESRVALRALVGFMLSIHCYRDRYPGSALLEKIDLLGFNPDWENDRDMVFEQLIRTVDTDRITQKLKEDLIPGLMKIKPFFDGINADAELDPEALLEDNPEWERVMNESGLQDRIVELSELQEQGSDVFMGTFSSLKNFPFFNSIENWFVPFTVDRSEFDSPRYEHLRPLLEAVAVAPVLCDNDKYSMALALSSISESQRSMITDRMKAEASQMAEIKKSELYADALSRKDIVNKYIQDLFRFYRLFNRANEMANPFEIPFNLLKIRALNGVELSQETLSLVGDFYMRHHMYDDALVVFTRLEQKAPLAVDVLQKTGHCLHRLGETKRAIEYLDKADIINGDDPWTLRNLGACLAETGETERAIECYKRAMELPRGEGDLRPYRALVELYIKIGNLQAMMGVLEHARHKDLLNSEAGRLLEARSLSCTPDFVTALEIYRQLTFDGARLTAFDLSARGYCEWLAGFREDAIETWRAAMNMAPFKEAKDRHEAFLKMMHPLIFEQYSSAIPIITDLVLNK